MDRLSYRDLDRPPLHPATLRRALVRPGAFWTEIRVVGQTASTNADAASAARDGAAEGLVVVAEYQAGGRGRQGREWISPPQAGLTFSVLLRPVRVPAERWSWLPLLTGLAVCTAIERLGEIDAVLKWPNDVLVGEHRRKTAGLLAEIGGTAAGPFVVIGIGLNVSTRPEELPAAGATSLGIEGSACVDRSPLLVAILRELAAAYRTWADATGDVDATGQRDAYRHASATLGHRVRVELPGGEVLTGEAVDIDVGGRLVVRPDVVRRDGVGGDGVGEDGVGEDGVGGDARPVTVAAGDVIHLR